MTVNGERPDANGDLKIDLSDIDELKDRVAGLDEAVNAETQRATGAEEALSGRITNEAQARERLATDVQGNAEDIARNATAITGLGASKADKATTYTKEEVDAAVAAATPADYDSVKTRLATVEGKIPLHASAQNQLADKEFVNSSIATNTATFRGTYNLVSDLGLTTGATHEQVAAAVATKLAALSIMPDHNDYCFVQVPRTDADPTVIDRIDRYKCSVEDGAASWDYEWSLNNSSFTAVQWAAINSGITSGLVAKLDALPTEEALTAALAGKASTASVATLFFARYYPDGSVKSVSEFTTGIKYDAPNTASRTVTVKPFCNTGAAANDNSGLTGRVVIPPFVDAQGNGYISDDGTRFKVVGVSGGSAVGPNDNPTAIIAPSTVTTIGNSAFNSCTSLSIVSLPAATTVGNDAFYSCMSLGSVSLPAVTTVGNGAFSSCSSLTSVSLPSATTIGDNAFGSCSSLPSVSLPSATTIGEQAFMYCTALSTVSLPAVTTVGESAFYFCSSLDSVSLPSATSIGSEALYNCIVLDSVDFGGTPRLSVPTLGTDAFYGVPTACRIVVPDAQYDAWVVASGWRDLVTQGYNFLRHSEWKYARKFEVDRKADKPATSTAGNLAALDANGNLTDGGVTKNGVESLLFAKYYPEGNVKSAAEFTQGIKYNAPDTTNRTITTWPFCRTDSMTDNSYLVGRVVIPPFVDAQGNGYISDDGTRFKVVGVSDGLCDTPNNDLTAVIAPNTVVTIGMTAFNSCTSLTSVSLPAVTTIGVYAFGDCDSLTSVSLPSATTIGEQAFDGCTSLTSVSLPAATTIGTLAFNSCTSLASVSLPAATTVGEYAFINCTALTSASLPAATSIGNGAFMDCSSLTSVSLPIATAIGDSAFQRCSSLTSVSLPAATTIGEAAFDSCSSLKTVSLPAAQSIGTEAFSVCSLLASVDFGATPRTTIPTLGRNAFAETSASFKIIVPYTQYDAWIAADEWRDLRYEFVRHAEKADKPATFTTGHLAEFDANGNPVDGGWTADTLAQYAHVTKTLENNAAVLDDRAINAVGLPSGTASATLTLPAEVPGRVRDFIVRLTLAAAASVSFGSAAGETVTWDSSGNPSGTLQAGTHLLSFTEVAPGVFRWGRPQTDLTGRAFDFSTTQGVMDALAAVVTVLGGSVLHKPSAT